MLLWLIVWHREKWPLLILIIAAITAASDAIDGWLARKLKTITNFGKAADRLADKLFLGVMFFFQIIDSRLAPLKNITYCLASVEVLLLIMWIKEKVRKEDMAARWWGKSKMILESIGILFCPGLIVAKNEGINVIYATQLVYGVFVISFLLALASLLEHITRPYRRVPCSQ